MTKPGFEPSGYITLTGFAEREGDQFASFCRELGTASCGDTLEEAFENLRDAVRIHLEGLAETGELGRFLQEKRIVVRKTRSTALLSVKVPPEKIVMTFRERVPLAA